MLFAKTSHLVVAFLTVAARASAFEYSITNAGDISLTDVETDIGGMQTIFVGETAAVKVAGLEWEANDHNVTGSNVLYWETVVDDVVQAKGTLDLSTLPDRELPTSLEVGTIKVDRKGKHEVIVTLLVDDSESSTSAEYQAFQSGAAIVPLIIVLALAVLTQMVELSLFAGVFVGACMVAGNLKDGFKTTLDDYILNALASVDHGYVYLFTLFLSGMVKQPNILWRSPAWPIIIRYL